MAAQLHQFHLSRHPAEFAHARGYVAELSTGLLPDVSMTAQLMTSELVTNALTHGDGPILLTVSRSDDTLEVEVRDASHASLVVRHPKVDDTHGRGLTIVAALAMDWGVHEVSDGQGKSVWFRLDARR